jgi:hypothetical protein
MAHFAKLDENNVVLEVLVVSNDALGNLPFPESEPVGVEFMNSLFPGTNWKQTSYNSSFRARYAGIGYTYLEEHDAFVPPKEHDYFVFDEGQLMWVPPVARPDDGGHYTWDDATHSWVVIRI